MSEAEREVGAERELFRRAFEAAPIGMALVAPDGSFLAVNAALCALLDRTATELLSTGFQPLTHPDDLAADTEHVRRCLAGEIEGYGTDKRYLRPDGSIVWAELHVSLITDESGMPLYFISQIADITDRKRIEAELRTYNEHLKALALTDPGARVEPSPAANRPAPVPTRAEEPPRLPPELGQRVQWLLGLTREHLGMDLAFLSEFSDGTQVFHAVAGEAQSFGVEAGSELDLDGSYCERMAEGRIDNVATDSSEGGELAELAITREAGVGSYVGVPMQLADRDFRGSLCVVSHDARPDLGQPELEVMRLLAKLVAEAFAQYESECAARRGEGIASGMQALLSALDARDHYTGEHSDAVVALAGRAAERLGLPAQQVAAVEHVARLHDIGKVGVPDAILQKPGRLSAGEWELMRQHPALGAQIVATVDALAPLAPAVRAEHERFDGCGYPDGLRGEEIPIAARITLACDGYHAMISERPYRLALSESEAREELRRGAGSQFDPTVVRVLLELLSESAGALPEAAGAPAAAKSRAMPRRKRPAERASRRWRSRQPRPARGDQPRRSAVGIPVGAQPPRVQSRERPLGLRRPSWRLPRLPYQPTRRAAIGGLLAFGVLLAVALTPWSADPEPPFGEGQPFIATAGAGLAAGGSGWSPVGYNDYRLTSAEGGFVCDPSTGAIDDGELAETLDRVQAAGGNVIRTWFFQSYWDPDRDGVGDWKPFDRVLAAAAEREIRVIPVLANHWDDCEAGAPQKDLAFYAGGYRHPYGDAALSYLDYAREVVGRYAESPTIAFWELVNEPEAPSAGACDEIAAAAALSGFAEESSALIRELAPNHLISLGTIGGDQCGSAGSSYRQVTEAVDICSIHAYGDAPQEPLDANIGACEGAGKPTVAGEVGLSGDVNQLGDRTGIVDEATLGNRSELLRQRLEVMLALGLDGFLIWELAAQPPGAFASRRAISWASRSFPRDYQTRERVHTQAASADSVVPAPPSFGA